MLMLAMAAFTLTSCSDVPMPYDNPNGNGNGGNSDTPIEIVGEGTSESPYNVESALQLITSGNISENKVYVEGIISQIDEVNTSYGNATYHISDDGTTTNQLEVYRGYGLNGDSFKKTSEIKVGDNVIVYGQLVYHNQKTPEFTQGSQIFKLNDQGGVAPQEGIAVGSGTKESPYNATAANQFTSSLAADKNSENEIYIKGKIAKIANNGAFSAQYGNATFYISDDGSEESEQFYVFRTLYLGNQKYASGTNIKVGDEVIICGKVVNYKGNTPETVANESYIYSLNGKTEEGGDTPATGTAKGDGTLNNPFNYVAATNAALALGEGNTSNESYYIEGTISEVKYQFDAQHGTATFFISDDGSTAGQFQIYSAYYFNMKSWTEGDAQIKVGDKVIVYGQLTNYKGTPETASQKNCLYSLNGQTGGDTPQTPDTPSGPYGTLTENGVTLQTIDLNMANQEEATTIQLVDNITLTFDKGTNSLTPKYYNTGTSIRMYPGNSLTITAAKNIMEVDIECGSNQGVIGNAEGKVAAEPGGVQSGESSIYIFPQGKQVVITNKYEGKGTISQIYIKSLTIKYSY